MKYGYPSGYNNDLDKNLIEKYELDDLNNPTKIRVYLVNNKKIHLEFLYDEEIERCIKDIMTRQSEIRDNSTEMYFLSEQKKDTIKGSMYFTLTAILSTLFYYASDNDVYLPITVIFSGVAAVYLCKSIKKDLALYELKKHEVFLKLYKKYMKKTGLTLSSNGIMIDINNLDQFSTYEINTMYDNVENIMREATRRRRKDN